MENFDLKKYLAENKLFEAAMACPTATQNLELNTKNFSSYGIFFHSIIHTHRYSI